MASSIGTSNQRIWSLIQKGICGSLISELPGFGNQ